MLGLGGIRRKASNGGKQQGFGGVGAGLQLQSRVLAQCKAAWPCGHYPRFPQVSTGGADEVQGPRFLVGLGAYPLSRWRLVAGWDAQEGLGLPDPHPQRRPHLPRSRMWRTMFPATPSSSTWHGRWMAPGDVRRGLVLASCGSRRRKRRHMTGGTGRDFGAPWGVSRSPRAWSRAAAAPGAAGARAGSGEGSSRARRRRTWWSGRRSDGGMFLAGGSRTSARGFVAGRGQGMRGVAKVLKQDWDRPGGGVRGEGSGSWEWPRPGRDKTGRGQGRREGQNLPWVRSGAGVGLGRQGGYRRVQKRLSFTRPFLSGFLGARTGPVLACGHATPRFPMSCPPCPPRSFSQPLSLFSSSPQLNPPLPYPLPSHPEPRRLLESKYHPPTSA